METKLKNLKSLETQEEYKSALVHRAFVREQIALSKDRILGLTEEIASEWGYVSNYKMILEDLEAQILSWEVEQEVERNEDIRLIL